MSDIVDTVEMPDQDGKSPGDLWYGLPINPTLATHVWNGREWRPLLTEEGYCKAEITRLRNELHIAQEWSARVIAGHEQDIAEITALRSEIERLRAALKERCPVDAMDQEGMTPAQAAIWHVWGERCSDFEPECLTCRAWAEFGQIARLRAALEDICMMDISWVGDAFKLKDIARAALEKETSA